MTSRNKIKVVKTNNPVPKKVQVAGKGKGKNLTSPPSKVKGSVKEKSKQDQKLTSPKSSAEDVPVQKMPKKPQSFLEAASSYSVRILANQRVEDGLKGLGISYSVTKDSDTNFHPLSAATRTFATVRAFERMYKAGMRECISLYSSPRDGQIVRYLNKFTNDPLSLLNFRPLITPQDVLRSDGGPLERIPNSSSKKRCFLMCDVYSTPDGDLNAGAILRALQVGQRLYWIGRKFADKFGVSCGEAAWMRDENEQILFRPDSVSAPYPPHSPCDWIWSNDLLEGDGAQADYILTWATVRVIGDYHIVEFSKFFKAGSTFVHLSTPIVFPSYSRVTLAGKDIMSFLPASSATLLTKWIKDALTRPHNPLYTWVLQQFRVKTVILPIKLTNMLKDERSTMPMDKYLLRRLSAKVKEYLTTNPDMLLLRAMFPEIFRGSLVEDCLYHTLTEDLQERINSLSDMMTYADDFSQYNQLVGMTPEDRTSWSRYGVTICGIGLVGIAYYAIWGFPTWSGIKSLFSIPRKPHFAISTEEVSKTTSWRPILREGLQKAYFFYRNTVNIVLSRLGGAIALKQIKPWCTEAVILALVYLLLDKAACKVAGEKSVLTSVGLGKFLLQVVCQGTWLTHLVVGAPIWEEHFKSSGIGHVVALALWETFERVAAGGDPYKQLTWRLLGHYLMFKVPGAGGVLLHAAWNFYALMISDDTMCVKKWKLGLLVLGIFLSLYKLVMPASVTSPFRLFKSRNYSYSTSNLPPLLEEVIVEKYPEREALFLQSKELVCSVPQKCPKLKVEGVLDVGTLWSKDRFFHWFLATNVPGFFPYRNNFNLKTVLDCRILAEAPAEDSSVKRQWEALFPKISENMTLVSNRSVDVKALYKSSVDPFEGDIEAEWLTHLVGPKRKRMLEAKAKADTMSWEQILKVATATPIMIKCDEMLLRLSREGDLLIPEPKPRAIANVDPILQYVTGPRIYRLTQHAKEIFSHLLVRWDNYYVSITFACGYTDKDLSDWISTAMTAEMADLCLYQLIVSGDDVFVLMRILNVATRSYQWVSLEGDATMFDQSQGFSAMRHEHRWLELLGLEEKYLTLLSEMLRATYVCSTRDQIGCIKIKKHLRTMRDTGGADTTLGNSINMMMAWVGMVPVFQSILNRRNRETIVDLTAAEAEELPLALQTQFLKDYGFKMKIKLNMIWNDGTFLKGVWYAVRDQHYDFYWGPLPSRVLKVGKSLKDPLLLFPKEGTYAKAATRFLKEVAIGYSSFLPVPLLRVYVSNFGGDLKGEGLKSIFLEADKHSKNIQLDEEAALLFLDRRYGITERDLTDFEEKYPKAAFHWFSHPVYNRLAVTDYS